MNAGHLPMRSYARAVVFGSALMFLQTRTACMYVCEESEKRGKKRFLEAHAFGVDETARMCQKLRYSLCKEFGHCKPGQKCQVL
jgi:hypothetical protein